MELALSLSLCRPGGISLEQLVAGLFSAGEQGAWYDPSGNNTTWRRNRLTRTEEFANAVWASSGTVTKTDNAAVAPDNTNTASTILFVTGGSGNQIWQSVAAFERPLTASVWLRSATTRTFAFGFYDNGSAQAPNVTVTSTWTRFSITRLTGFGTGGDRRAIWIYPDGADTNVTLEIWHPQLEDGIAATAYQAISTPEITYLSTVQAQPLLFQNAEGTLPVTEVEQPVGLMLDRRKGLALGSELVTNGDFSNGTTGWTLLTPGTSTVTVSSGQVTFQGGATEYPEIKQTVLTVGKWYKATFTKVTGSDPSSMQLRFGDSTQIDIGGLAAGTYSVYGVAAGNTDFKLVKRGISTSACTLDNISVKLLDGNHAYQTSTPARPHLRSRYNLLTYSEQFDNAAWNKEDLLAYGSGSVANATTAPDGTTTADLLVPNTSNTRHGTLPATAPTNSAPITQSVYAKAGGYRYLSVSINGAGSTIYACVVFDLQNGTASSPFYGAGAGAASISGSISAEANGFYRCSVSVTAFGSNASNFVSRFWILNSSSPDAGQFGAGAFAGDGTSGIYLWGAQVVIGTATLSYQRIAATPTLSQPPTYATVSTMGGEVFRPYLFFDGADVLIASMTALDWIDSSIGFGIKYNALISENDVAGGVTNSATGNSFFYVRESSNVLGWTASARNDSGVTGNAEVYSGSNILPHILTGTSTVSTVSVTLDNASASSTNIAGPITPDRICVGALARSSTSGYVDGHIYGAILTRRSWTAAELTTVKNYLAQKTGVTL